MMATEVRGYWFSSTMWSSNYARDELVGFFSLRVFPSLVWDVSLWAIKILLSLTIPSLTGGSGDSISRVLRVHIGRSNGGVVKPSLLFECLAFALSVRVRRKTHPFLLLRRKLGGTKREETPTAHAERTTDWTVQTREDGLPCI
ncbi:hypothetical protein PROFUN_13694 [Planoprotostelium fungivorum]|uniref:Uncharacterized protein n=1 Tax=Planoprotostelium fungivorum TaxID=1890364 RepID=A0A2P6N3C8_9EUKA|nr:hypothetical protein PROFUN_13694 [Planoprotostelium fungivorum]